MNIKTIRSSYLRNNEHFQFYTEVKDLLNEAATRINFGVEHGKFNACYDDEDKSFKKIVKSATTEEIENADHVRDRIFSGMVGINKATLNDFEPDMATAAKRIKVVLDTYGNVAVLPLNEETSAIYNLLQELRGGLLRDVKTVGLERWINKLDETNKAFDTLVKERNNENAAKTHLKMKECRVEIDRVYSEIINRVNASMLLEGEARFADFVNKLNTFIDKYNNIVAQRKGRNKKGGDSE